MPPEIVALQTNLEGNDFWTVYYCNEEQKSAIGQIGVQGDPRNELSKIRQSCFSHGDINFEKARRALKPVEEWVKEKTVKIEIKKNNSEEQKTKAEIAEEYAKKILETLFIKTFDDTKDIYYFNFESGLYEPANRLLEKRIQEELAEEATNTMVEEVLGRIKRSTYISREEINEPYLIPLDNGIYDFEKDDLVPYTPSHFFLTKHSIVYDPMAMCPNIIKFIGEVCEFDEEKEKLLYKIAGYGFIREYPIQQAFMMFGGGSNGKSVYLNLLREMYGHRNVVSVSLQDLMENRFTAAKLYLKSANIMSDIQKRALKEDSLFKSITGGDWLTADQKFKESFDFKNYSKQFFSCNTMPEVPDPTDAFFRRWIIVEFTKQFLPGKQDPHLIKKIATKEEKSGFFNLIMPALREALSDGKFSEESIDEVRNKWLRNSNSTNAFCYEMLELADEDKELKENLWEAYLAFCERNKLAKMIDKQFWRNLHNYFEGKTKQGRTLDSLTNERKWVIFGVHMKREQAEDVQQKLPDTTIPKRVLAFIEEKESTTMESLFAEFTYVEKETIEEIIKVFKKNGEIYEPVHGTLKRDKK